MKENILCKEIKSLQITKEIDKAVQQNTNEYKIN